MATEKTKSSKSANKNKSTKKPWFWRTVFKIFIVLLIVIVAAGVYFDAQIKQKFEGNKWQLPVLVYGVEHSYKKSDALSRSALIQHLELLDYRKVRQLTAPGEFKQTANGVAFFRRAYSLPRSEVYEQVIEVNFYKNRIDQIKTHQAQSTETKNQTQFTLEPYLIDRLQANNLEDRILVKLHEVPKLFIDTLLLVEDQKFYQHHGVAPLSIARALWVNIQAGRTVQGGSTLTQQLVKNMFLTNERSLWRKLKEAYIAILLDARYNKSEILQAYLNEVYLGQNHNRSVHGIGLASHYYFKKPVNELAPHEIATLVGMIKGPSYYNPSRHPERAMARRDLILRLMTQNNLISAEDYQYEITRDIRVQDKNAIAKRRYPDYIDQVQAELKRVLDKNINLHSGLKIFTHFDPLTQYQAQTAISSGLNTIESQRKLTDLQAASLIIDSASGGIQAIVGDRQANYEGFNRALNAQRNIGSLVKPAVYLTALEQPEYNLASILKDQPIKLASSTGKEWAPKNYDKQFLGDVLLVDALVHSRNVPTVNLGMSLGLKNVADTLMALGLRYEPDLYPSMLLGSISLSPFEVAELYQVFANFGQKQQIHAIQTINSMDNQPIWQYDSQPVEIMNKADAYLMNYALNQVTRKGSAKWLNSQFSRLEFAGKTGTTNDLLDSWFVGYDQAQLAVFWIGKDDNQPTKLTGATGALRLFGEYQKLRTPSSLVMAKPDSVDMRYFNQLTGEHALPGCENLIMLPAKTDLLPPAKTCAKSKEWEKKEQDKSWLERLFNW
ncbi:penicillin-binding protein 1B [Catenovulum sp. 2E275]|uniref:penicillin-binding protein 1B n=1 Tax=Catenovulum sp. 2E275 TaxID=2980497 RepID=UPI0021D0CE60|nr:penicillin-binding protein 1B [Catenovulum sp. 2E275]MCU4674370.1 penicillin-binding protein 1B [Catenovulum sp. 2E275]